MAEKMSVTAVLSAVDRGFSSTINSARTAVGSLSSAVRGGLGFGVAAAAGMAAFNALTNGARDLVGEISSANATWETFNSNMAMLGKSGAEIAGVKKDLQKFAEKTIYSSSDMASTYSQLAAVGVKSADKLVTAFGGLAAAAEDPKQAMKTLSQQATQMAAKPMVAWQDFKLMLEQTPAGVSAVAREMGMTTQELVTAVQSGTVATEEFFEAVQKAGNSQGFYDLATQAKTVGQAMDGLKETLGNKLGPAFAVLSTFAIGEISKITDKLSGMDAEAFAAKVSAALQAALPYWEAFKNVVGTVGGILKTVGGFMLEHADIMLKVIPVVLALVAAYNAFKVVNAIVPYVSAFTNTISTMANGGIRGLSKKLYETADGEEKVGRSSKLAGKNMLFAAASFALMGVGVIAIAAGFYILAQAAIDLASSGGAAIATMFGLVAALVAVGAGMAVMLKMISTVGTQALPAVAAMLLLGVAVVIVAAGFALFANTAIQLSSAGGTAIAVMFGLVAALAALMAVAAVLAPALTAGAVGFLAFGAAILMVGAGALLAASALAIVAAVLPTVATYGMQAATAVMLLGTGMLLFAAGGVASAAACVALAAGLTVLSAAMVVSAAGVVALGAGMTAASVGVLAFSAALGGVARKVSKIAAYAADSASSIMATAKAATSARTALSSLGNTGKSSMRQLESAMNSTASAAENAGQKVGQGFTNGMRNGLAQAPSVANQSVNSVVYAFNSGYGRAYSAGAYIGKGLANGIDSMVSAVRSAANRLVNEANRAIEAKAKIGSPSKITTQYGKWYGEGWVNGIDAMVSKAKTSAENLFTLPNLDAVALPVAFGGELSGDYDYYRNAEFIIDVPLTVDGREIARATATYTEEEINRQQTRANRKRGII